MIPRVRSEAKERHRKKSSDGGKAKKSKRVVSPDTNLKGRDDSKRTTAALMLPMNETRIRASNEVRIRTSLQSTNVNTPHRNNLRRLKAEKGTFSTMAQIVRFLALLFGQQKNHIVTLLLSHAGPPRTLEINKKFNALLLFAIDSVMQDNTRFSMFALSKCLHNSYWRTAV